MADIIAWRFLVFAAAFGLLIYLHFYLGRRQWSRLKGEQAGEIDVGYVRTEAYLSQSFRRKVEEWRRLPASEDKEIGTVILKGQERIRVLSGLEMADEVECADILVLEGDFFCGRNCTLTRELLVHGNANIGAGSRLQALAADRDLVLGEDVSVTRWLDSGGELTIGAGSRVGARVTSLTRIQLGIGARVISASAPELATTGWDSKLPGNELPARELLEIDFQDDSETAAESMNAANLHPGQFLQLSPDTWWHKGDVQPRVPVRIKKKLAVTGNCYFPEGSVLESDVRASGSIFLGPSCVSQGNLVADRHIFLAAGCRFSGLIHAGRTLLLSRGTRGFRPDGMVAAYAEEGLSSEGDVAVKGKIASGGGVVVIDGETAKAWRTRRRIQEDGSRLERR